MVIESPGFAVNEVPLLLSALHGGKSESNKGTYLPDPSSQRASLGSEFKASSS